MLLRAPPFTSGAHLRLGTLSPPYLQYGPAPTLLPCLASARKPGTIVVLNIGDIVQSWPDLFATVPGLRSRFPWAPVIVRVGSSSSHVTHLAGRAGQLHIRAVLADGEAILETLLPILTDAAALAPDAVEWLNLRGLRLNPGLSHLLTQIFTHSARHANVGDILRMIHEPETSARFRCRKRGLPSPTSWLQVARSLATALRIQAEPETPLLTLAFELGFSSHSALSQQVYRAFGLRPGALRGTMGWEWLLSRWVERFVAPASCDRA